jgi:hypothetical protein
MSEMISLYKIEGGKRVPVMPRRRWQGNIKIDLKYV